MQNKRQTDIGEYLTTLTFAVQFDCILNLKKYPLYTSSFKYIFPDLNTNSTKLEYLLHFDDFL